jgi:hypothetical protein
MNYCWRGPPGAGKRFALLELLEQKARERNIPFRVQNKLWSLDKPKEDDIDEDDDDGNIANKDQIPFESSAIHYGFDISRMSLQDRHIIRPILERLGKGSHVLTKDKTESRILVFYHIHLLSTESVIILQSLMEQDSMDIQIWATSEHPLPLRIAHHFQEIPVGGKDKSLEKIQQRIRTAGGNPEILYSPQRLFDDAFLRWSKTGRPVLKEVQSIRAFVYECLIRNVRWIECLHHSLLAILKLDIPLSKKYIAISVLANQEGSSAGQTIPSYRIPIAWEGLFIQIRDAISLDISSNDEVGSDVITSVELPRSKSQGVSKKKEVSVDKGAAKPKRPRVVKKSSGGGE